MPCGNTTVIEADIQIGGSDANGIIMIWYYHAGHRKNYSRQIYRKDLDTELTDFVNYLNSLDS